MTLKEIFLQFENTVYVTVEEDKEVSSAVVGDLLSVVMGDAPEGAIWVTVQNHLNVAAVAVLKEFPAIIITLGRVPEPNLVQRCQSENIALISVKQSAFEVCKVLAESGING